MDSAFISDDLSDDSLFTSSSSTSSSSSNSSSDQLFDLSLLMANLPIKRGLSQCFQGKSQSFSCLSEASCIEDLAKKENPHSKRMKYCKRNGEGMLMDQRLHYAPNICSRVISKKVLMCSSDSVLSKNRSSNISFSEKSAKISLKKTLNE